MPPEQDATSKQARAKSEVASGGRQVAGGENLAGRGIGDFTEDCGAAGARCARNVGRPVVEGFVGEEGKGERFFGVTGDAEFARSDYADVWKSSGELGEEERVLCAPARDDELVDLVFAENKAVERVDDG